MLLPEVLTLAEELLEETGLDRAGWTIRFERSSFEAGSCDYSSKEIRLAVSSMLAYDDEDVRQVIIHEMAHALLPPGAGHEKLWRAKVKELGGVPKKFAPKPEPTMDLIGVLGMLAATVITGFYFGASWGIVAIVVAALISAPLLYRRFGNIDKVYKITQS